MRPIHCVLAAFATVFAAGCAHRADHSGHAAGTSAPHAAAPGPAAPVARSRLMHIYVDAAAPAAAAPFAADLTHADTVARALRDQLRRLGYDVRGTDSALPRHDAGAAPGDIARSVAAGQPPPDTSRAVTYLHPNAPRLLLFVHLQEEPPAGNKTAATASVVLGAFIADSTDGTVLWSNRVSAPPPTTDDQLRLLANRLIRTLPSLPPA